MLDENFVTLEIGKAKHIALVAHDGKKKELVEWCDKNKEILKGHFSYNVNEVAAYILKYVAYDINRFNAQHKIERLINKGVEPLIETILER